ncbi:Acg family FMN-binding oxidoreductase [Aldersonia kunmingensis]|uniref:Acg family FMN-binding oxidoreductase n=1 Tax=Aldersonia kunmingensis TaxID=408066 RepID=UPI00082D5288|nr:nitroreductase family protein [Aldersonia kunmingensis]
MTGTVPDNGSVRAALALAVRAPSIHNSQPWRWRIGERTVHLFADPSRNLRCADPDSRELVISCGAALHHFRVAMAALGGATHVHRLPDPNRPNHLAAIEISSRVPSDTDIELAALIPRRRSDRRTYSDWPVPDGLVRSIVSAAAAEGLALIPVEGSARAGVERAIRIAAERHESLPDYESEMHAWSGRHASPDGVPARNTIAPGQSPGRTRAFAGGVLAQSTVRVDRDAAVLLMLATPSDDRPSQLRAGEAASAALLAAASAGLAACPLTEPLEISDVRSQVRRDVLSDDGYPQMILRIGWAPMNAEPVQPTPRRPLDDVLDPFDAPDQTAQ